jgi:hypothetical protein
MLRIVISLICFVTVPVLLFLAWKGWAKGVRAELPPWRNGLCISALLLLLLNWLGAAVLEVPVFVNPRMPRPADLMQVMLTLSHPLGIVVLVLAFAFRRVSRVQTVVAALLMLVSWPLGYV